ncbi:MAG: HAD family phosphatase [Alphaproteobacteria bacterium]|nr:HAD family phosphatase [Alphaproteobacteria bacterium]
MTPYRIIFCDIDGTLLDSKQLVRPKTKMMIRRLSGQGIPFVLISGRMSPSVEQIQQKIGFKAPYIAYGGALIHDMDGQTVWNKAMPVCEAVKLRRRIHSLFPDIISYTFSGNSWITDKDDGTAALYLEKETTALRPLVGQPEDVLKENDCVHKVLCTGDPAVMDELQNILRREFPDCAIFKSLPRYLEIMSAKASKSKAADFLCRSLGLNAENVIAFGDNFNDIDLLEYAGLGVAMDNAPDAVKNRADLTAPSHDEEGVRQILEQFF